MGRREGRRGRAAHVSGSSSIEWTDATWNPLVGCTAVSPGCDHCYAARETSGRLRDHAAYRGLARGGVFAGEIRLLPDRLDEPLHWRRPRRVFVNSMSDLFHADVPIEYVGRVMTVMGTARQHTFQVLTKRGERMQRLVGAYYRLTQQEPFPNVWLGVSVETEEFYWRINRLARTPAAVRFLSCEPLLGPLPDLPLDGIHWVIVGGESGPGARPMHPQWARDIRDQCQSAGVAFFFKQWGEWAPERPFTLGLQHERLLLTPSGSVVTAPADAPTLRSAAQMKRYGRKVAGRHLDGRTWDEMPASAKLPPITETTA